MIDKNEFDELPPEEQLRVFHSCSLTEKSELLPRVHEPESLTGSLSQEELYLITREMDLEERSGIIRFANLPQLRFLSDMECWERDRLPGQRMTGWLETLIMAGDQQVMTWFKGMDYPSVVAGLKSVIGVIKPDWEDEVIDDIIGDQPYFTLDRMYYILCSEENMETVKRALEILFEKHRGLYTAFLEGVLGEGQDLIEEEAYGMREARLADRGFPDVETAHSIYRRITREEFDAFPLKKKNEGGVYAGQIRPAYNAMWKPGPVFLDAVLELFRNQESVAHLERIEEELAWLSNKVLACDGIDFSSEEKVRRGVERARHYVSIGLELLAGSDVHKAAGILSECWLEPVFRLAATAVLEIRDQAGALVREVWGGQRDLFLDAMNPPYEAVMMGLLEKIPRFFDAQLEGEPAVSLRDYASLDEIEKSRLVINQIRSACGWLLEGEDPSRLPAAHEQMRDLFIDGSFFAMLASGFALSVLDAPKRFRPLGMDQFPLFLKTAFRRDGEKWYLSREIRESFLQREFPEEIRANMLSLWGLVFDQLEQALEGASEDEASWRLTPVIWFQSADPDLPAS